MFETQIKNAVTPGPHQFVMDVIEYDMPDYGQFIGLRFYSNQWMAFTDQQRADCAAHLIKTKQLLEAQGVRVTLEPVDGEP